MFSTIRRALWSSKYNSNIHMNRAQVRKLTFGQLFLCLRQSHSVAKPDYFPFGHRPAMTALHRQACLRSAKRALEPEHVDERYVQSRVQILPVGSRGQSVEKTQRTRIAAPMEEHRWENVNEMKMLQFVQSHLLILRNTQQPLATASLNTHRQSAQLHSNTSNLTKHRLFVLRHLVQTMQCFTGSNEAELVPSWSCAHTWKCTCAALDTEWSVCPSWSALTFVP